jgi:proline dehydrogenase
MSGTMFGLPIWFGLPRSKGAFSSNSLAVIINLFKHMRGFNYDAFVHDAISCHNQIDSLNSSCRKLAQNVAWRLN